MTISDGEPHGSPLPPPPPGPGAQGPEAPPSSGLPGLSLVWRGPLLAYGLTLVLAVVLTVLAILALGSSDGREVTGDSGDFFEGLMAFVAMPFQLTAMALGGRLHVSSDGFGLSVVVLPLLLTALYAAVVNVLARRAERSVPSRSHGERVLLSGIAALLATVVIGVLTRLFALRADGAAMHALSVSLVFGTLLITFVADVSGRLQAGSWPSPATRPWPAAAAAWVTHVACFVAVSLPVIWLALLVESGFRASLATPLVGPTAGLWAYALGHLSAVSAAGDAVYAWGTDPLWAVLMVVLALGSTLVASLVWFLRGRRAPAELGQPQSWLVLPVTFAAGGFLVWLFGSVYLGGELLGVSGSVMAGPAAWTPIVLAIWGAVAEVLSRTVAPRLAGALPRAVVSRAGAGATGEPAPAPLPPAQPLTPQQRRRVRLFAILGGGALAVLVLGAVAVSVLNSRVFSAEAAAGDYLDALARGDVDAARAHQADESERDDSLAIWSSDADDPTLLTQEVYRAAEDRPTSYKLGGRDDVGDDSVVFEVTAQGGVGGGGELTLVRTGTRYLLFDRWEVSRPLTGSLNVSVPGTSLTVNGVDVKTEEDPVAMFAVFPGRYTVDPWAGNPWVESSPIDVAVPLGGSESADGVSAGVDPSPEFTRQVDAAVAAWLDECLASTEPDPADCPNEVYTYSDVRNLSWELTSEPTIDYDYFLPEFPMDLSAEDGTATATWEEDESYGFGPKDWQRNEEESDLYFTVTVDEEDGELVVTPQAW